MSPAPRRAPECSQNGKISQEIFIVLRTFIRGYLSLQSLQKCDIMEIKFKAVFCMRVTFHNGRGAKGGGVFSSKHNDRNFNIENADHIDPDRQDQNFYWHCYKKTEPNLTFEQAEKNFYSEHFGKFLTARNEKYLKQRHKDKVQTIDDYLRSRKSCPEEIIFAIGNVKDFKNLDTEKIAKVYNDFRHWRREKFPNVVSLNVALHADEEGVPHIQERVVWIAHDENGNKMVSQGQALKEMGVEIFDPSKKESRYNNAKITFTRDCREKFFEICRAYGIEIEEKPKERSEVGLSLMEYKTRQEEVKIKNLKMELEDLKEENKNLTTENEDLKKSNIMLRVMRDDYAREAELNFKQLEKLRVETREEKKEFKSIENNISIEREKLETLENLVKVCGDNKELDFVVDVIKANNKTMQTKPVYDRDGQMVFNDNGKPKVTRVGALSDLTAKKLLNLIFDKLTSKNIGGGGLTMYTKKDDLDDWNLLSEAEKEDRKVHQAFDNY